MARLWRFIELDNPDAEELHAGRVDAEGRGYFLHKVYTSLTNSNQKLYYNPNRRNAPVSYTKTLINLYNNLIQIPNLFYIRDNDNAEIAATKRAEYSCLCDCLGEFDTKTGKFLLSRLIEEFMQKEYPNATLSRNPKTQKYRLTGGISEQIPSLKPDKDTAETLHNLVINADKLFHIADNTARWTESGLLPPSIFSNIKEAAHNLNRLLCGREIYSNTSFFANDVYSMQTISKKLLNGGQNHTQNEKILANMLASNGFELHRVEVNPDTLKKPSTEQLEKAAILRIAFDGIIERPRENRLSTTMRDILKQRLTREGEFVPQMYELEKNRTWTNYAKIPALEEKKSDLLKALCQVRCPPQQVVDLTLNDINFLISMVNEPSARKHEFFAYLEQSKGTTYKDGAILSSDAHNDVMVAFATTYTNEIRADLAARKIRYDNPTANIFIDVAYDKNDIESIINELHHGHNGSSAFLTGTYKNIIAQLAENNNEEQQLRQFIEQTESEEKNPYLQEKIFKDKIGAIMVERGVSGPELKQFMNSLKFNTELHHGFHIFNNQRFEQETGRPFTDLNSQDNVRVVDPLVHRVFHLLDNVDDYGSVRFDKDTLSQGTCFHDKKSGKYFTYEIRPLPHVQAYLGNNCLITDDKFLTSIEQEVKDFRKTLIKKTNFEKTADQKVTTQNTQPLPEATSVVTTKPDTAEKTIDSRKLKPKNLGAIIKKKRQYTNVS